MVEWARATAVRVHAGQTYNDQSYFVGHLEVVAELVRSAWKPRPPPALLLAGAYLHDAFEDTELTDDEVKLISPRLALLVRRLTRPEGLSRRDGNQAYYAQIRQSPLARHIKVADRLANVRSAVSGTRFAKMYLAEREDFNRLRHTYDSGPTHRLWSSLGDAYEHLELQERSDS